MRETRLPPRQGEAKCYGWNGIWQRPTCLMVRLGWPCAIRRAGDRQRPAMRDERDSSSIVGRRLRDHLQVGANPTFFVFWVRVRVRAPARFWSGPGRDTGKGTDRKRKLATED